MKEGGSLEFSAEAVPGKLERDMIACDVRYALRAPGLCQYPSRREGFHKSVPLYQVMESRATI